MADKKNSVKTGVDGRGINKEVAVEGKPSEVLDMMLKFDSALSSMVDSIIHISATELEKSAAEYFGNQVKTDLHPHEVTAPKSECRAHGSDIGAECSTYHKSESALDLTHYTDTLNARSALGTAITNWHLAVRTYQQAVESAKYDRKLAVDTARTTFEAANNSNDTARTEYLTATFKVASVNAHQTFEAAVEAAGTTLASDAGTLIAAYAAFVTATLNAPLTKMNSEATAEQTFWTAVETKRDS